MWSAYHKAIADDIATNFANKIEKQLKKLKKLNKYENNGI